MHREGEVGEDVLIPRIRSAIGHVLSRPHDVEVATGSGTVTLRGKVYQDEIARLIRCVRTVPGVHHVVDQVNVLAENAPAGDPLERKARPNSWSPAWRLAAMAGGGFLTLYGLKKRGVMGTAGASLGGTLLKRALNRA
jgi:hypothetical protein